MAPVVPALQDLDRRKFIRNVGVAAAAGAVAPALLASPAEATHRSHRSWPTNPLPEPIEGSVDSEDPGLGFIRWSLHGPAGVPTPLLGLPGFGLDVDPSLITDFEGFQAMTVLNGSTTRSDGSRHPTEFDVRVFQGHYVAADGETYYGTFGFF